MKFSKLIQALILIIFIQSCAVTKLADEGQLAYEGENYEAALTSWDQLIESTESKGKKEKAPIYYKSGISALKLDQIEKAQKYLESAKEGGYSSPELYSSLASIYKTIDNLSKEITALETYREKYPQGADVNNITARLLETYVESENWDFGVSLWSEIEEQAQSDVGMLVSYLIINKNLNNNSICDKLAQQIIEIESNNINVLEYYAEKYFWIAENLYVTEMKAYKNKKTSSQYKKLLKALNKVWPNYQKSRDYFLRLYEINPKPEYAQYLGNIYTRYEDNKKAAYYYKRAK
jgi:tetratricopeptide (TPR) repeat protein